MQGLKKKKKKIQLTKSRCQDQVKNAMLGAVLLNVLMIRLIWKRKIVHQMNKSLLWKNVFCSFTYVKIKPPNTVIYPGRLAVLCTNHLFSCCSSSRLFRNENKQNWTPNKRNYIFKKWQDLLPLWRESLDKTLSSLFSKNMNTGLSSVHQP